MARRSIAWHRSVCCDDIAPIRSMAGVIAISTRASTVFGCVQDAAGSPVFPPQYSSNEEARQALLEVLGSDPRLHGKRQSRWDAAALREVCPWLNISSPSGLSRLCTRLHISFQRGRDYLHSPDPQYCGKCMQLAECMIRALCQPERYVLLYLDEVSFYRQPSTGYDRAEAGREQPLSRRSHRSNTCSRIVGAMELTSATVLYRSCSKCSPSQLLALYRQICERYAEAEEIYVVQDNWPVHFHPGLLAHLQPQEFRYAPYVPQNWHASARDRTSKERLPIRLINLPTYAPWLNPIEKLWRALRQNVTHLHRMADQWDELKDAVNEFLDRFSNGSNELLRAVGLLPE